MEQVNLMSRQPILSRLQPSLVKVNKTPFEAVKQPKAPLKYAPKH